MDTDLIFILGLVLAALSVPATMSAISDGRAPRAPILIILIAGAMIVYAVHTHPGGYAFADIPDVFFGVIGRYLP
ncbi:hypothetical protein LCL97_12575 [Seohaeicola saemankumensis]|nr:hypothetical protein [Seohaeicola saemankumensis]MCA0871665.1 hypothetical protein [Seohaeicola saemankumensis]